MELTETLGTVWILRRVWFPLGLAIGGRFVRITVAIELFDPGRNDRRPARFLTALLGPATVEMCNQVSAGEG